MEFDDIWTALIDTSSSDQVHQLQEEGLVLRFCKQITSGVAALHSVGVVPNDLALRCCQLTADLNVKVGDYGLAPTVYLEDYVPLNGDNQPVRWMPPEVLAVMDRSNAQDSSSDDDSDGSNGDLGYVCAAEIPWTKKNGVWSLAVTLWEVTTFGERPFDSVSDNQFVVAALSQPITLMAQLGKMRIMASLYYTAAGVASDRAHLAGRGGRGRPVRDRPVLQDGPELEARLRETGAVPDRLLRLQDGGDQEEGGQRCPDILRQFRRAG
jgi:serine/threonine protein kinase